MTKTGVDDAAPARELLRDSFTRLIEHVEEITDGLTEQASSYRPTPDVNSVAWLLWHSARCQDLQICDITGAEEIWTSQGWFERFGLALPVESMGYGHTPDDVAKVVAPADLLAGYYRDVHDMTLRYIATLTAAELSRIVDRRWKPPVTTSARLVSIVDDCAQHLGQAAYLRGLLAGTT